MLEKRPKLMFKQTIVSGGYTEFKTFDRPIGYDFSVRERISSTRRAETRRSDNVQRAKKKVFRLTMANELRMKPIFLTLTYEENMCDRKLAVRDVGKFFRRLRTEFPNMGYLYTLERQKRGAWHAHILLFNVSFIPISILQHLWDKGMFDIKKTNDAIHVAFYLSKYITEDGQLVDGNKRVFSASHNLCKPQMFRYVVAELCGQGMLTSESIHTNIMNNIILTRTYYDKNRRNFPISP